MLQMGDICACLGGGKNVQNQRQIVRVNETIKRLMQHVCRGIAQGPIKTGVSIQEVAIQVGDSNQRDGDFDKAKRIGREIQAISIFCLIGKVREQGFQAAIAPGSQPG